MSVFKPNSRHLRKKRTFSEDSELEGLFAEDSCQTQEELEKWLKKSFRNASKLRKWFRRKEIGFRTSWSQEMLNGVPLLVNSCFKDRIGRGFYIALWPATKNGSTTIIPNAENHGEYPDMPPRLRSDRIFTVPRLCSAFGGNNSVWSIMSCWNRVKPSHDKIILQHDNARRHVAR